MDDATVFPDTVRDGADHLTGFLERSLPQSSRAAPRRHATRVLRGRSSGRERTTWEPIAIAAGGPRTPIQLFVSAGLGDDEAVRGEVRLHGREALAEPDGVVVLDPRGFPKTGTESCGVARQGCGRWGAVDICQVGVVWADAASAGSAPWDRRLDLREDWADDAARHATCHVPPEVKFQEKWRSALDVLDRSLPGLAHGGIVGADDLGRAAEFRAAGRPRPARDVRDGPCNTYGARPRCGSCARSDGASGGKTPAVTASQTRRILTRWRRHPAPSPEEIAEEVTRVLRRHEESRIYHWHARPGAFPPRRSQTDSS